MKTRDTRGARYRNLVTPRGMTLERPSEARLKLLEGLHWFGKMPTSHAKRFLELGGNKYPDANSRALRDMRHEKAKDGGHYLVCPSEQFPTFGLPDQSLQLVYDLGDSGLKELGKEPIEHGGWYHHQLAIGCIGAEFYFGASQDYTFIPRHQLTTHANEFSVMIKHKTKTYQTKLRTDLDFVVDYGGKKRIFFVEINRGGDNGSNETVDAVYAGKKTILRSLLQMREFIGQGLYKEHFGEIGALSLQIFTNEGTMHTAMNALLRETGGKGNNYILFRCDPRFHGKEYRPPFVSLANWTGTWERAGRDPLCINFA